MIRLVVAAALLGSLAGCDSLRYFRGKHPRAGATNPERMDYWFWKHQIKTGQSAYQAQREFHDKSNDGAVWTFDRWGMTKTPLADGATIYVGGEHEDGYDPNFHIYNDVIILKPGAEPEIYGYPEAEFPPTDFHTATPVDGDIFLIGALGYPERRRAGTTPVYRLNIATRRISFFPTSGNPPGWLYKHKAVFDPKARAIVVTGGKVQPTSDVDVVKDNLDDYRLRLKDGVWEKLTNRRWLQFRVGPSNARAWLDDGGKRTIKIDNLLPAMPHVLVREESSVDGPVIGWSARDIVVRGVTVHYVVGLHAIDMTVRGNLPPAVLSELTQDLSAKLRRVIGAECRVQAL